MSWGKPIFTPTEYNAAGKVLVNVADAEVAEFDHALIIINNWRSSHYHPLNTIQNRLRRMSERVDGNSLVVQRIKRLASIKHKLERFPTMRLTQIQDIGGCRAILSTIEHLEKLVNIYTLRDEKRLGRGVKHKLIHETDYIKNPKKSGYRGVHLIFKFHSDKILDYEDLKIEIQFRTNLQHAWATAVETIGIFIGQALKSSMGEDDWLRFFSLASSAMAAYEGTSLVPGMPESTDDLRNELREYAYKLKVIEALRAYKQTMQVVGDETRSKDIHYYLLILDMEKRSTRIIYYRANQLEEASAEYLEYEKKKNVNTVLVSAESISSLRKAYPNYFVDTETFISYLQKIIA